MKDNEESKVTGVDPTSETEESSSKLGRGTFLKALGVGLGAVGLDVVTGGHLAARTAADLHGDRSAIQKLVRGLLEEPVKAKDFLENPQVVAREFGISLSDEDVTKIQASLKELANQVAARLEGGHQDWAHQDGNWNDWYDKKVERTKQPSKKIPTQTKPPAGTKRK